MGFFSSGQKNSADEVYKKMRNYLHAKDGKTHIVMVNSFSKWINQFFGCEDKYTTQIDEILSLMQEDGYEIIDVKFNSLTNQGITGMMEGFHTLIVYR
ncbi:MAG: hypothetical protein ACI4NN_00135 [Pyramidobacter sp.]